MARARTRGDYQLDYDRLAVVLAARFSAIEAGSVSGAAAPEAPGELQADFDRMFQSDTQAFREGFVGCILARLQDRRFNIRTPYIQHGADAFNGRTLDNRVVNPFLKLNRIPSSTGPYLSSFRRSIRFVPETEIGLRDGAAYASFLNCIAYLEGRDAEADILAILDYTLHRFLLLREAANVPIARVRRMSAKQYARLIQRLLATPSGGRIPMLLVIAMFRAILARAALPWTVAWQGINVADAPSGAIGDVTVMNGAEIIVAAEVTERAVDRERLLRTFQEKISEAGVRDYLFFATPEAEAEELAEQYFAQGHEINFVDLPAWLQNHLISLLADGRALFNAQLEELIGRDDTPTALKLAWNGHVNAIASGE